MNYYNAAERARAMRIYIIAVQFKDSQAEHISQNAYHNLENAQQFIESRSDKPERISPMRYESEDTIYKIYDVLTVDERKQ